VCLTLFVCVIIKYLILLLFFFFLDDLTLPLDALM
jgi:branched-subunit amino acid transport protein